MTVLMLMCNDSAICLLASPPQILSSISHSLEDSSPGMLREDLLTRVSYSELIIPVRPGFWPAME